MKIEFQNEGKVNKIDVCDVPNGTLVIYGNEKEEYGYGIVLRDWSGGRPIIYDLEHDEYYDDIKNYVIHKKFDKNLIRIVVE